jgi:tetratricopeptide (TPR) repeat protein
MPTPEAVGAASDAGATPALPPPQQLAPDLLYAVLVAEVAARRGDLATAFTHYLGAAELARSEQMAELAVQAAIRGEDEGAAERGVTLWLQLAPQSAGAHRIAALLRIKAGDREGALTHLARLVKLVGADAGAGYLHAAEIIGRGSKPEERVSLMQDLVGLDPDNPDAHYALAMVAAGAGRNEIAAASARRALDLRPDDNKPRLFLVRLLLSEGKRDAARALLEEYVAAKPDDHSLRMVYGQFLVEEKEFSNARAVFERLLNNRPKEPDVLFAVGILSLELGDLDSARIYLTRLYQTGERRDDAAFYLGQVEERAQHPAAALDWYAKSQGANLVDAQVRVAVLRGKAGEVDRAREIVQQLRDQSPDEAQMLYMVEAEILDQAGRQEQALAVYGSALEAFPDEPDLRYGRAMLAVKMDRIDDAERDLRGIIDANPEHADALNALGYTLADRTDRYQEAQGYIEQAHRLKPDEASILDSMGWVNFRLGQYEVALDYLRQALARMNDGEIAAHLGEVLWAMGRQAEAREVWEKATKDHPDHAYLRDVVERHGLTRQSGAHP